MTVTYCDKSTMKLDPILSKKVKQPNRQFLIQRFRFTIEIAATFISSLFAYKAPVTNRVDINFNSGWKYNEGDVAGASDATFIDNGWQSVNLPHSTKWVTPEDKTPYNGISWYRKHFTVDNGYQGRKVFLEFEAAMQYAEVWVNGTLKIAHEGGYMGFTVDITNNISFGTADNVIAVSINNAADERWAPGYSNVDFQYFGGLYRDVNLHITDKLHVTDAVFANKVAGGGIFVTYPSVSATSATVSIKTDVINENAASKSCTVVSDIVDAAGAVVGTSTATVAIAAGADNTFVQSITLSNPKLWHPNTPDLYSLFTTVNDGATSVDNFKTRIGVRTIQWSHANGILINGQSYKAQGANMHQDIFGLGNAMPKRAIYYDVKRFKEAGLNFVRGCHYPHNAAFYDACDEFGILVEDPMTGWQHYFDTDTFKNNTYKEVREMVRRDRNHPCIAIWETQLNETDYPPAWAFAMDTLARHEFGGAPMATCGTATDGYWNNMGQVVSVPWDVMIGSSQGGIRSTKTTQPVIICEYGSWDYGGESSTSDVTRQSADALLLVQCDNIQQSLNNDRAQPWYCADAYWIYADYAGYITTGYPTSRLNGCGIMDYYRIPKFSYYFFQSQRDPAVVIPNVNSGPMVYIANRWTPASPTTVRVFSNCAQVSLYRDATLIATQSPDIGANTASLLHPPFTFTIGGFTSGTLRAVGKIGGVEKAWDTVRTPGAAVAVRLRPESADPLDAGGSDARLVWIDIIDANGTVVYGSTATVSLSVTAGSIVGPTSVTMKAGQLATWVRSGAIDGAMTLAAQSVGLTNGTLVLSSGSTAVVPPPAMSVTTYKHYQTIFVCTSGTRVHLPAEFEGKSASYYVYAFSGKLVHKGVTRNRTIAMNKATNGIYIVKVP
jgi:hypothetical protein